MQPHQRCCSIAHARNTCVCRSIQEAAQHCLARAHGCDGHRVFYLQTKDHVLLPGDHPFAQHRNIPMESTPRQSCPTSARKPRPPHGTALRGMRSDVRRRCIGNLWTLASRIAPIVQLIGICYRYMVYHSANKLHRIFRIHRESTAVARILWGVPICMHAYLRGWEATCQRLDESTVHCCTGQPPVDDRFQSSTYGGAGMPHP